MNIYYNQLRIRNAEKKDCEQLARWWNDGKVMAHAGFPNGLGTTVAEIEKQIANDSDKTKRRLVIEYKEKLIGEMSFYVYENAKYEIEKIKEKVKTLTAKITELEAEKVKLENQVKSEKALKEAAECELIGLRVEKKKSLIKNINGLREQLDLPTYKKEL